MHSEEQKRMTEWVKRMPDVHWRCHNGDDEKECGVLFVMLVSI